MSEFEAMKQPFVSLGHAIISLNPKIGQVGVQNLRQFPVERFHNAYFYFQKTGRGSGLIELAVLLEDQATGWLRQILPVPRGIDPTLYQLINEHGLQDVAGEELVQRLDSFRRVRRDCAHRRYIDPNRIEGAFWDFLYFAKWYYREYYSTELFDINSYIADIPEGEKICKRFEVVKLLGRGAYSQTYQVKDSRTAVNANYYFTAKRVLISAPGYEEIVRNEREARPLFNDNPNVGRFYSSHDDFPVGEVLLFEYIDGWTLKQWITDEHKMRVTSDVLYELVYIIGGVLRALREIHDRNYVHGIITPHTILVTRSTKDARLVSFERCTPATRIVSKTEKDQRALDDYSPPWFGVVGKYPVVDTYAIGRIIKEILSSATVTALIPPSLQRMIDRATSDNPRKRYSTANEMYEEWVEVHNDIRTEQLATNLHDTVALISCSKRKLNGRHRARDLYSASEHFVKALKFAEAQRNKFNQIYFVSGRHGLVEPDQMLDNYDFDLKKLTEEEQNAWATYVVSVLRAKISTQSTTVTVFADKTYSKCLLAALTSKEINASRNPDFFQL